MALIKTFISTFGSFDTNTNPQALSPGYFIVAQNVSYQFDSQISGRHGHPDIKNTTIPYLGIDLSSGSLERWKGLYKWDKNNVIMYILPRNTPMTVGISNNNIGIYKGTLVDKIEDYIYYPSAIDSSVELDAPFFQTDGGFIESQSSIFVMAENGMYFAENEISNSPFVKLRQPFVPGLVNLPAVEGNPGVSPIVLNFSKVGWLTYSRGFQFRIVIVRDLNNNQIWESKPNSPIEVFNWTQMTAYPTITIEVGAVVGFNLKAGDKFQIYRTKAINYGEVFPDQLYLSSETVWDGVTSSLSIDLLLPDSVIASQVLIYNAPIFGGNTNQNVPPPIATNLVFYQGYTWYTEVTPVVFAKLGLISLPGDGDTLTIKCGNPSTLFGFGISTTYNYGVTTNVTFTFKNLLNYNPTIPTDVLIPFNMDETLFTSNLYKVDSRTLSFQGIYNPAYLLVKVVPGTTTGQVRPYAQILSGSVVTGVLTINFTPGLVDTNKFSQIGIVFVCSNAGVAKGIFSYNSLTINATSLVFNQYKEETTNTFTYAANDYLYVLSNGGTVDALQFYDGDGSTYYSLLPAIDRYPPAIGFLKKDVGQPLVHNVTSHLIRCEFIGLTFKSQGALLDQQAKYFVQQYNATVSLRAEASVDLSTAATIIFMSEVASDINIYGASSNGSIFNPPLLVSDTQFSRSSYVKSGIIPSKFGRPQVVNQAQSQKPISVGNNDSKIIQAAPTTTDLYIFKEDGLYRLTVSPDNLENPKINAIVLVDPTILLLYQETVQVVNDMIFFLSTQGIHVIFSGRVELISKPFERDLLSWLGKLLKTGLRPKSVINQNKRYYLICFPGANTNETSFSMCFDTLLNKWSKWDRAFDYVISDSEGKLTSINTDYALLNSPTNTDEINTADVNQGVPLWQYVRQDKYTSDDVSFVVVDNDTTVNTDEDYIVVEDGDVFEPYSPSDQYDEIIYFNELSFIVVQPDFVILNYNGSFNNRINNLREWIYQLKNRQLWIYATVKTSKKEEVLKMWPVNVTDAVEGVNSSQITLQVQTDERGGVVTNVSVNSDSYIAVGVNIVIEFSPFNASSTGVNNPVRSSNPQIIQPIHIARPTINKFFSEFQIFCGGSPSYVSHQMRVDHQTDFTQPNFFTKDISFKEIYRTNVPLSSCRGTYISVKISHSTPFELFRLQGIFYSIRDTSSQLSTNR